VTHGVTTVYRKIAPGYNAYLFYNDYTQRWLLGGTKADTGMRGTFIFYSAAYATTPACPSEVSTWYGFTTQVADGVSVTCGAGANDPASNDRRLSAAEASDVVPSGREAERALIRREIAMVEAAVYAALEVPSPSGI